MIPPSGLLGRGLRLSPSTLIFDPNRASAAVNATRGWVGASHAFERRCPKPAIPLAVKVRGDERAKHRRFCYQFSNLGAGAARFTVTTASL